MSERKGADRAEFTIREIAAYIFHDRSIILTCTLILLAVVFVATWATTPKYRGMMLVAPASGGLIGSESKSGPLGTFSTLLGRPQDITPFDIYLKYYRSLELAEMMDKQHGLMKIVFANQWDQSSQSWRLRRGVVPGVTGALRWTFRIPGDSRPTMDDLRAYLERAIVITPGDGQDMQTITADDRDRVFARNLIFWAHQSAETLTKRRMQKSTVANIEYLKQKLQVVSQSEQRLALGSLLIAQESQLMLLQSWNGYASDVIEAASASARPVTPNPPLMIVMGLLGGLVVGGFISVVRMLVGVPPGSFKIRQFFLRSLRVSRT